MSQPRLVCVGTGISLAGQATTLAVSYIKNSDVVFFLMADQLQEDWLRRLNANAVSLQRYYALGKSRAVTYEEMVSAVLQALTEGRRVCLALYGHPGVFAVVAHRAIERAKERGYSAHMEPAVSAEDCLYADLGLDPGTVGLQQYEASQFMFYRHAVNPSAYLVLWQVSIAGEHTLTRFETTADRLQVLVNLLCTWYPPDHRVTLYEAATLPVFVPRIEQIRLVDLPHAALTTKTTLIVPPASELTHNIEVLSALGLAPEDLGRAG